MNKRIITSAAALAAMPVAFANETPAKAGTAPTAPKAATPAAATSTSKRVAPELTGVRTDIPMPTNTSNRGSKSSYDFDKLTVVGASFGVKNKTAKGIASIVSNANKKGIQPKKNADGTTVYKMGDVKDANGVVIGSAATSEPETEVVFHFFAVDVDPATDKDGASVRVFRDK